MTPRGGVPPPEGGVGPPGGGLKIGYFGLKNRPKIEIFIPMDPGSDTQFIVDLSRKIEFLPKKGLIIGKNARFSVKTDAEGQILYVQR